MPSSISSIKVRIKSINSTKKITGAMKSVSSVKLNRMSKITNKNKEYKDALETAAACVFNSSFEFNSKFINTNSSNKKLYIVFASDVGLCGSFNMSLIKFILNNVNKTDLLYIVGISIYDSLKKEGFNIINKPISSDNIEYYDIINIFDESSKLFLNENISEVNVIYNRFVNSITYKTDNYQILPFIKNNETKSKDVILEPNPNDIFDNLLKLLLKNQIYNLYLNSKTSEQVARRFAMENATKNAEDLISDLTLEYNKARQSSITQEITEIVAGANAI